VLARHGIRLRDEVLEDRRRTILTGLRERPGRLSRPTARVRRALDELQDSIETAGLSRTPRRRPTPHTS